MGRGDRIGAGELTGRGKFIGCGTVIGAGGNKGLGLLKGPRGNRALPELKKGRTISLGGLGPLTLLTDESYMCRCWCAKCFPTSRAGFYIASINKSPFRCRGF